MVFTETAPRKTPDDLLNYAKKLGEGISNHEDVESMNHIINSIEAGFGRYIQELTEHTKDNIITPREAEEIHKSALNVYRSTCTSAVKNRKISINDAEILNTLRQILGLEPGDVRDIHADIMEILLGIREK
jgi:hypothetical protein